MEAGATQGAAGRVRAARFVARREGRLRAPVGGSVRRDRSPDDPCQFSEKKAAVLSQSERRALVEHDADALPLGTQADLLSISRRSLYYQPKPPPPEEVAIKHRIDELYTAHPFYGSRKLTVLLEEHFAPINRKRVQRYMREIGIAGIAPGPNLSRRALEQRIYPYLLRGVTAQVPDHIWGCDITYIRLRTSWL